MLIIFIFGVISIHSGVEVGQSVEEKIKDVPEPFKKKDYKKLLAILKPLSDVGNAQATSMLGYMHSERFGIQKSKKKQLSC